MYSEPLRKCCLIFEMSYFYALELYIYIYIYIYVCVCVCVCVCDLVFLKIMEAVNIMTKTLSCLFEE